MTGLRFLTAYTISKFGLCGSSIAGQCVCVCVVLFVACVHLFSFSMISIASSVFGFAVGSPPPVLQYAPVRSPAVVCRMPWEPVESEPKEEEAPKEVRTQATKICISTVATLASSHRP